MKHISYNKTQKKKPIKTVIPA